VRKYNFIKGPNLHFGKTIERIKPTLPPCLSFIMRKKTETIEMVTGTSTTMPTSEIIASPTGKTAILKHLQQGHHMGDLFRRHRMNQAEVQNDAQQHWFQNARKQQNCEQANSVFKRIN
jgi:hypothetical protein